MPSVTQKNIVCLIYLQNFCEITITYATLVLQVVAIPLNAQVAVDSLASLLLPLDF